jgi:hypothetical protein
MNVTQAVRSTVESFRRDVPDYVASGVVDMTTGMLLAADTVDGHPDEILDVLAAATVDLLQGRTVVQVENMWNERRGDAARDRHYFQEVLVQSDNLVHLFLRSQSNEDLVGVVVCRRPVNVGLLFTMARQGMHELGRPMPGT